MKNMKSKMKTFVVCAALLVCSLGMTAFAASGSITGSLSGTTGKATLKNTSGFATYCMVFLQEYNTGISDLRTIKSTGGVISSGNTISATGTINKSHAKGVGEVYNSAAPASGVAKSYYTQIK